MTRLFLSPLVTGLTVCHTNEGNTTKEPFGNISVHVLKLGFFSGSSFHKSNSNSPPLYSFGSVNVTVTDYFLIFPFAGPSSM